MEKGPWLGLCLEATCDPISGHNLLQTKVATISRKESIPNDASLSLRATVVPSWQSRVRGADSGKASGQIPEKWLTWHPSADLTCYMFPLVLRED